MKDILNELKSLVDVQGRNGNWNYDRYMHGMYNGMEVLLATIEKKEPVFKDAPEIYLIDKKAPVKKPTIYQSKEKTETGMEYFCPECKHGFIGKAIYCPTCGEEIIWSDYDIKDTDKKEMTQ
ncbi:MAG: hypothetical protein GY793_09060 [Proteobacteria bacterium]|nr:hypothetical protein [Pseudomonadota bacterium]